MAPSGRSADLASQKCPGGRFGWTRPGRTATGEVLEVLWMLIHRVHVHVCAADITQRSSTVLMRSMWSGFLSCCWKSAQHAVWWCSERAIRMGTILLGFFPQSSCSATEPWDWCTCPIPSSSASSPILCRKRHRRWRRRSFGRRSQRGRLPSNRWP